MASKSSNQLEMKPGASSSLKLPLTATAYWVFAAFRATNARMPSLAAGPPESDHGPSAAAGRFDRSALIAAFCCARVPPSSSYVMPASDIAAYGFRPVAVIFLQAGGQCPESEVHRLTRRAGRGPSPWDRRFWRSSKPQTSDLVAPLSADNRHAAQRVP